MLLTAGDDFLLTIPVDTVQITKHFIDKLETEFITMLFTERVRQVVCIVRNPVIVFLIFTIIINHGLDSCTRFAAFFKLLLTAAAVPRTAASSTVVSRLGFDLSLLLSIRG